eukprot:1507448-Pyramimonas_sp.AAC.1
MGAASSGWSSTVGGLTSTSSRPPLSVLSQATLFPRCITTTPSVSPCLSVRSILKTPSITWSSRRGSASFLGCVEFGPRGRAFLKSRESVCPRGPG